MQKYLSDADGPAQRGRVRVRGVTKSLEKTHAVITVLYLLAISLIFAGCGGGGGSEGVSSQTVSGVAAAGAPLAGEVKIKDSSTPAKEKTTVIASDGSFALDVTDMKAPFILQAEGSADGETYRLHSFADGAGTANINPLANAAVADAAEVDDPAEVYEKHDVEKLEKIRSNLPRAIADLLQKIKPLLKRYDVDSENPITVKFKADHTHYDGLFDDVKIVLQEGILTITNKKTQAVIYTGKVSDILNGYFTDNIGNLPNPGSLPTAPSGLSATSGAGQITVSWTSVGNAVSYNIYWSTTSEVTTTSGTKIAGATTPYVHNGLAAGTSYYYIVTAVSAAGEGVASAQASATTINTPPLPTVPAAPTDVTATGGTKQTTVSWSAVSGATSYNIYWSTSTGVTKATVTKLAGVTSPAVHTGLIDSTTYYYIVTAMNGVGESAASVQVAATTLASTPSPTAPEAPTGVSATGGANQATISWSTATGATSYNVYWSTTTGVTKATGTKIAGVTSPYVHTGLSVGTAYYYIVTAVNSVGESLASSQAMATTNPPPPTVPSAPTGVTAAGGAKQVTISWSAVSGATSYNLYWSTASGLTIGTGAKITGATSPYVQTGLADGTAYYYIVTAVNGVGESAASAPATASTNAPVPTVPIAPTGVTATGGANQVSISWSAVSGATSYNLYWSLTSGLTMATAIKITGVTSPYVHTGLLDGTAYYFIVTAVNGVGEGAASTQATATTNAAAPPPIDGAALYTQYCASCHGPLGSSDYQGTTADAIITGNANVASMRSRFNPTTGTLIKLTADQIAAIAAALQ
jgi:fibronectin type 3 domain-containing protein